MRPQEQLAPTVLDYDTPPTRGRYRRLLRPLRICAFACLIAWGFYVAVGFRGWGPGSCLPEMFLVTGLFAGIPGCLILLGLPGRRYLALIAALIVVPALLADGYGTLEEKLFVDSVRALPPTTAIVSKPRRWWPNESCYLYYDPSTGKLGGGD